MAGPGSDLPVTPGPGLPRGLTLPAAELVERFSRSSGPGGQSVNTTDSRVELEYDVSTSTVLDDAQRARLTGAAGSPIVVVASENRSQHRNRVAARERLVARIREGLAPPPPTRRATRPSRGAKERRLKAKKERGQTKVLRSRPRGPDARDTESAA